MAIRYGLYGITGLILFILVGVNWQHATDFMSSNSTEVSGGNFTWAMFVFAALLLSLTLAAWLKYERPEEWYKVLGAMTMIILVESYSFGTSSTAMTNRVAKLVRTENVESQEYRTALNQVDLLTLELQEALRRQSMLPDNYHKVYANSKDDNAELRADLKAAKAELNALNVSTMGQTEAMLQEKLGLGLNWLMILAAVILTFGPLALVAAATPTSKRFPQANH